MEIFSSVSTNLSLALLIVSSWEAALPWNLKSLKTEKQLEIKIFCSFVKRQGSRVSLLVIGSPVGLEVSGLWSPWWVASLQPRATSGKQTNTVAVVVMTSLRWTNIAR